MDMNICWMIYPTFAKSLWAQWPSLEEFLAHIKVEYGVMDVHR
jgi:hypothetical protein